MTTTYTLAHDYITYGTGNGYWFKQIYCNNPNDPIDDIIYIMIRYHDKFDDTKYKVYINTRHSIYLGDKVEFIDNNTKMVITDSARLAEINRVERQIAIKKIIRNKLYYLGLAKKLSMRDCGINLVAIN